MDDAALAALLDDVRTGSVSADDAVARLRRLPFADLGFAKVDHHRALRQGWPEAVYAPGKSPSQCAAVVTELLKNAGPVLLTRADDAQLDAATAANPGPEITRHRPGVATAAWLPAPPRPGHIPVVTAGTADLPVATECTATLTALGFTPTLIPDCGVAGVHRVLASADELAAADAIVVIAGMEGALASVVGGLTGAPVVAVPTSAGYGAALEGVTALLAMLSSCAAGITVVGIDNGFGAACAVARMLPETTMNIAWFHCFAGIAGDMAFGSLVDAGADLDEVLAIVRRVPADGWSVEAEATSRNGIAATRLIVRCEETGIVRTHAHIRGLLEEARMPGRVLDRALTVFGCLAEVEGRLHRRPAANVHFHEVGGLDAIVDIVGTSAAMEVLGIDTVHASAVATGTGMVRTAHGMLPNPAPAVVELLRGAPTYGVDTPVELTTPTGAALLAATCEGWGPLPAMTITATGFGAGTRELADLPNLTQVVVGVATATVPAAGQPVVELATNLDDATGETLAHAVAALLDAGAVDAWVAPIVMKKGRPGHTLFALADPALAGEVARTMTRETGTLGVRWQHHERWVAPRSTEEASVEGLPVRVKVSPGRVKAEHDDAARVAARTGLPLREVARRAEQSWSPPDDAS